MEFRIKETEKGLIVEYKMGSNYNSDWTHVTHYFGSDNPFYYETPGAAIRGAAEELTTKMANDFHFKYNCKTVKENNKQKHIKVHFWCMVVFAVWSVIAIALLLEVIRFDFAGYFLWAIAGMGSVFIGIVSGHAIRRESTNQEDLS